MPVFELTWLGGNPGDGWYEMTSALVDLLGGQESPVRLRLVAGGGEENLDRIQDEKADLGMSIDVVVSAGFNGAPPFATAMPRLNTIGTGWSPLPYNLLEPADAVRGFADAIGTRALKVGAPPRDTTDELMFQRVVAYYGTTYDDIERHGGRVVLDGYDALVAALEAGEIDYVFGATTMPAPSIAAAAEGARPVRLAALPADLIDHLVRRYGCSRGSIPAGTYPGLQSSDVATAFVQTVIVVSTDVPEPAVFEFTRLMLRNLDRLPGVHPSMSHFNPYTAWRNVPAPVHPGAVRAYREAGFLD